MIALLFWTSTFLVEADAPASHWWDAKVEASLRHAPDRERDWEQVLEQTKPEQRAGMAYLLTYMPLRDLKTLPTEAIVKDVELAYQARGEVPWGSSLPDDVFLDAVLPYANVTEPRESMRAEFHDRYLPLVKDCKTPGEAGRKINENLFKDYKVSYNTRRRRTDQSAKESIAQGKATCTGLTIMLVDACRAVGVPARLAGINSWPGRGGNHTWTEIWDDGAWHYAGSAEPDGNGLDHAWFGGDASRAIKDKPRNAIYAVTYRETGEHFPVAWDEYALINAENVTDRYTKGSSKAPAQPRLMVEVRQGGRRVEAQVTAVDQKTCSPRMSGTSLGPQADINLHLSSPASPGETFLVVARLDGKATSRFVTVEGDDKVVRIDLDRPASDETRAKLADLLADRFGKDEAKRDQARKLLAEVPADDQARALAWKAYQASPEHEALRKEFDAKTVETKDRKSPYLWRHVGEKPKDGWGLFIAMHGGGGAPQEVNDQQWHRMFDVYFKDHPEAGGYIYLSLRAPNNAWNGFYDDAICPMVERLIRQFVLFADVDPDRVYTLGASHGGYGAFVIGPKIPYRFAAVHSSAAAATDGETMGENLRNTRFTFMVGEKDTDYGRADRCQRFAKQFEAWRAEHGGYPGGLEWVPGEGHHVNAQDKDKTAEMLKAGPRDPWPPQVVWVQSDDILRHFYWIEAPKPTNGGRIEATVEGNTITVKAKDQDTIALWLDDALVDLSKPVTVEVVGGKAQTFTPKPNLETYALGLEERADPRLAAPVRVEVSLAH